MDVQLNQRDMLMVRESGGQRQPQAISLDFDVEGVKDPEASAAAAAERYRVSGVRDVIVVCEGAMLVLLGPDVDHLRRAMISLTGRVPGAFR